MTQMATATTKFWRYMGLAVPVLLWLLFFLFLFPPLRLWLSGARTYDKSDLQEWIDESRIFRETLPEMVSDYQQDLKKAADYQKELKKVPDAGQRDTQKGNIDARYRTADRKQISMRRAQGEQDRRTTQVAG